MQGEINVLEVMTRQARLQVWQKRQQREAEWVALKQWWAAERSLRKATSEDEQRRAKLGLARTAWLYRRELGRAWPKSQRARLARWHDDRVLTEQ